MEAQKSVVRERTPATTLCGMYLFFSFFSAPSVVVGLIQRSTRNRHGHGVPEPFVQGNEGKNELYFGTRDEVWGLHPHIFIMLPTCVNTYYYAVYTQSRQGKKV